MNDKQRRILQDYLKDEAEGNIRVILAISFRAERGMLTIKYLDNGGNHFRRTFNLEGRFSEE